MTAKPGTMVDQVARAICCPDGVCHIEKMAQMREALLLAREKLSFYDGQYRGGAHIGTVRRAIDAALAEDK